LQPGDRPIYFSLFDPDTRGLPFHRTAAFLTVPLRYRFEFLFRNPHSIDALTRLYKASHALSTRPRTSEGFVQSGPEGQVLLNAVAELRDRFGIRAVWVHEGKLLDSPMLALEESFPDGLPTLGKTRREQLQFRKSLAERRREYGIMPPRRQPDDWYKRLLAVWDAREGWVDKPSRGYDPEHARSLQSALTIAGGGSSVEDYYRAFQFVSGLEYSKEAWLVTLGIFWRNCNPEILRRRGTGRRKKEATVKDGPVVRFLELVRSGIGIAEAARTARLSALAAKILSDPDNWDAVREFMQCPEKANDLLASLWDGARLKAKLQMMRAQACASNALAWSFVMAIDLQSEQLISFAKATQFIPPGRNGKKTHISTLLRWATKGAKAPDGTIVRLEAMRLGGRWLTSCEALQRFAEALTPRLDGSTEPAVRSAKRRKQASVQAAAELDKLGI
jgi:hypothetical protein